jgi:ribosome biogenesis GTPase
LDPRAVSATVLTALGPVWLCSLHADHAIHDYIVAAIAGTVDCPHTSTIVAVGDVVWIVPDDYLTPQGDRSGTIVKVEARRTLLSRKVPGKARREQVLVANVDQLGIVVAAAQPAYHKRLIDRYLIAADKGDLRPFIVVNKSDLIPDDYADDFYNDFEAYRAINIPVLFVSAESHDGLDDVRTMLQGASTLLSGPSGVGKSSLINLLTDVRQEVGDISQKYDKGRHTTTAAQLFPLDDGGSIVDSPGIREFAIWELSDDELPYYFEEFTPFASQCRFSPCSHTHEPSCAVKDAVDAGLIDEERYISYVLLREGNMDDQER